MLDEVARHIHDGATGAPHQMGQGQVIEKNLHELFTRDAKDKIVLAPAVGRMYSDVVKIRQCLLNLLSNASKFTQKGKITLRVERVIEGQRPFLRFDVIDSGPGISTTFPATSVRRKSRPL